MIARQVLRIKSCIYESATEFPPWLGLLCDDYSRIKQNEKYLDTEKVGKEKWSE